MVEGLEEFIGPLALASTVKPEAPNSSFGARAITTAVHLLPDAPDGWGLQSFPAQAPSFNCDAWTGLATLERVEALFPKKFICAIPHPDEFPDAVLTRSVVDELSVAATTLMQSICGNVARLRRAEELRRTLVQSSVQAYAVYPYPADLGAAVPAIWKPRSQRTGDSVVGEEENFLTRLLALHRAGETDRALDLIFLQFDRQFCDGAWTRANTMLVSVNPAFLDEDLIVGMLAATRPAKHRLSGRASFVSKSRARLAAIIGGAEADSLMSELD